MHPPISSSSDPSSPAIPRRRFLARAAMAGTVVAAPCLLPRALPADDAPAAAGTRLFNGKDLDGWEGAPGWWTVEDGALTAESTAGKPCKACNYLVWQGGRPSDFELTCEFKLSAAANSGVQVRSETRPDWDTYGYQADMTGDGSLVGFVYHHKLGLVAERGQQVAIAADGKKEVRRTGDPAALLKHFKREDWNQYRIVCRPQRRADVPDHRRGSGHGRP